MVLFDGPLILLDLLLVVLRILLTLHVIADQRACSQTDARANRRAGSRTAERRPDQSACGGAAERADSRAFFPRRHRPAGAAD